ncbi:MAG: type II toxin-antitoxin system RelE/ParE family toxin [Holosporales bacterium]|jgi:mRNA interferase RelE/StbE|nr:type II toxin-antitoxin system RelE/ParE family toxin [Holosporales bacterium]
MYEIQYSKNAAKRLDNKIIKEYIRLIQAAILEKLSVDPFLYGSALKGDWKGHYKLRVGTYRIVYRIDVPNKIVRIVAIDHRRMVYNVWMLKSNNIDK